MLSIRRLDLARNIFSSSEQQSEIWTPFWWTWQLGLISSSERHSETWSAFWCAGLDRLMEMQNSYIHVRIPENSYKNSYEICKNWIQVKPRKLHLRIVMPGRAGYFFSRAVNFRASIFFGRMVPRFQMIPTLFSFCVDLSVSGVRESL